MITQIEDSASKGVCDGTGQGVGGKVTDRIFR